MHKIYTIIVSYNPNLNVLINQITLIIEQNVNVIVVDNKSFNYLEVAEQLSCLNCKNIELIQNELNLGLAKAQNIGIRQAIDGFATHVVLFDQDSIPEAQFFDNLLKDEAFLIKNNIPYSSIGPRIYSPNSSLFYPFLKYFGPFVINSPSNKKIMPREAVFIIASGSLINVSMLQKVGVMNEDLFIDYIDVEWCLRAKNKGYGCFVSGSAKMSHCVGDNRRRFLWRTISEHSPLRRYYLIRNYIFILKLSYVPVAYKLREAFLNVIRVGFSFFATSQKTQYIKYFLKAVKDAINGRYGKIDTKSETYTNKNH